MSTFSWDDDVLACRGWITSVIWGLLRVSGNMCSSAPTETRHEFSARQGEGSCVSHIICFYHNHLHHTLFTRYGTTCHWTVLIFNKLPRRFGDLNQSGDLGPELNGNFLLWKPRRCLCEENPRRSAVPQIPGHVQSSRSNFTWVFSDRFSSFTDDTGL